MRLSINGYQSPRNKQKAKRNLDNSQIKVNSRYAECQQSNNEVSNLVNQSMAIFQQPQFIDNQIDDFQSRLALQNKMSGFCKIERQKSLLLSNTEGYRRYKKEVQKKGASKRYEETEPIDNPKEQEEVKAQQMNECEQSKELEKNDQKYESESLTYSTDSLQRKKQRVQKRRSIEELSFSNESKEI